MRSKKDSGAATGPAPLSEAHTLLNGREVRFVMPDMFAFASGKADIPNQVQAEIYQLIYRGNDEPTPEKQFFYDQRWSRTLYYIAQMCIHPRVKLEADEEGEIDVRELALSDLLACFSFFRYGPPPPVSAAADQNAGESAATPSTGDDVPPPAE